MKPKVYFFEAGVDYEGELAGSLHWSREGAEAARRRFWLNRGDLGECGDDDKEKWRCRDFWAKVGEVEVEP